MMTLQEIFDTVAKHLLTQNVQSKDDGGMCVYRGPNGRKCAAGAILKDEYYKPSQEGNGVYRAGIASALLLSVGFDNPSARGYSPEENNVLELLSRLQRIHDDEEPENWAQRLRVLAVENRLSGAVVDQPTES